MKPLYRAAGGALAVVAAAISVPVQAQTGPGANLELRVTTLEGTVTALRDTNSSLLSQLTALQTQLAALQAQVTALQASDQTLQSNINAEAAARQAADTTLQQALNAEAAARQSADQTLQGNLDQEIAVRGAADTDLQARIAAIDTGAGGIPGLADYLSVDTATHTVLFKGANVQIVNGMGATSAVNGRGNLIVGYNTPRGAGLIDLLVRKFYGPSSMRSRWRNMGDKPQERLAQHRRDFRFGRTAERRDGKTRGHACRKRRQEKPHARPGHREPPWVT